jgi:hypothetical protein
MAYMSEHEKRLIEDLEGSINEDKILNKLQREYDVYPLLDFNEITITEKIQKNPFYIKMFRLKQLKEKNRLELLEDRLKERESELYDYLKFHDDRNLTKTEIERYYLNLDDKIKELKKGIYIQRIVVDYFGAIIEAFTNQHWAFKNWLDTGKGGY